jgi:hypothetical protein
MEHKLLVPVRAPAGGMLALRIGRLSSGERTGLAFTSEATLVRTLGPDQQWTDLSWEALLDLLEPLGIEHVRVDPDPDGRPQSGNSPQPVRALPVQPHLPEAADLPAGGRVAGQALALPAALRLTFCHRKQSPLKTHSVCRRSAPAC